MVVPLAVQLALGALATVAVAGSIAGELRRRRQQRGVLDAGREGSPDPGDGRALPPASVVVPVKGHHQGLADNLRAFLAQDHPDLEILFVVDDLDDPAAPVIEKALAGHDGPGGDGPAARLLSVADHGEGVGRFRIGKSRAHAAALGHLRAAAEIVVFADADARPRPDWARRMTAPLATPGEGDAGEAYEDRPVGAVTTYRWYVSERHGFWSRLRAQWNASGHDALLDPSHRFCWGGSMATRRELLDDLDVLERMRSSLADDVALTEAVHDAGYRIVYAPRAACLNVEDCDREGCLEWCVRQTAIVRETMPGLWRTSLGLYGAGVGAFALGAILLGLAPVLDAPVVALSGLGLTVPVLLEPLRTRRRWRFFRDALGEDGRHLDAEPDLPGLALGQPFFTLWVLVRSARLDAIRWRGRTYPLDASGGGGSRTDEEG